ncbi:LrgA family protein [Geobacter metallireducens RCH3]|uniref:Murein hydrolase-controlling membrane protein LrgA n=1 Tax=Geobacter metallireducens (strain ATCC 53774 / DSM 7210 / GS-15) TaxID=269799 RepID=Q39WD2_GEOMG|nr:CidA/LrgA family protein [Geobacter metallireducens]ABB31442.1 murein hydrolase-controlling membrane protein LrgA [Geobacter metallireducens GS-15]EHP88472.1 LrgA family protein [Geobacter metallireducens RCH3]
MLGSLTLILICQLIGEIITRLTRIPVPGPVIGMVLLFCGLVFFPRRMPSEVETVGGFLLRYLALLFVPAGVGVITHLDLLMKSWAPLFGAIIVGTLATIGVTGLVMKFLNRRLACAHEETRQ